MKNYYEILGVSENVTKDVLDSVYKKLMEDTSNMSEEKKQEIQEAYYVLSNTDLKGDNGKNVVNEIRFVDRSSSIKKAGKWIFLIAIVCILIWGITSFCSNKSSVSNSVWGTFENEEGEMIVIEQKKDLKDDMYWGYLSSSKTPWIKETVMLNLDENTIKYINNVDSQSFPFEIKKKKLKFKEKTYTKISDEYLYDKVLDKDKMTVDDVTGTYKNASSYYVVIEQDDEKYVDVILCDNWGKILGTATSVEYDSFFGDGKVSVFIEDGYYDVYFLQKNIIKCEAYLDNYVKQEELKTESDTQQDKDIEINTSELLSLDIIQNATNNLLVNGAYKVKDYVGKGLRSIDEFYITFVTVPNEDSIDDIQVILAFSYEYYEPDRNCSEYGRIAFTGSINGEDLEMIQSEDETETIVDDCFSIVQGSAEGYQRLNDNRNDCWYQRYDDGEIEYIYAIWDKPEMFSKIVDFDSEAYMNEEQEDLDEYGE